MMLFFALSRSLSIFGKVFVRQNHAIHGKQGNSIHLYRPRNLLHVRFFFLFLSLSFGRFVLCLCVHLVSVFNHIWTVSAPTLSARLVMSRFPLTLAGALFFALRRWSGITFGLRFSLFFFAFSFSWSMFWTLIQSFKLLFAQIRQAPRTFNRKYAHCHRK